MSTSNQKKIGSSSYTYSRSKTNVTRYLYAKLADVDRVGGTMTASLSFTIPKLPSFTVKYDANGGSGAPSSQTKLYDQTLKLSTTKPTRTGYTFQGWAKSSSGSVTYAPGDDYTSNSGIILYAVWKAVTYKVTYNANGGTGAPNAQTKTYGVTLKLSSVKPTRTNYNFVGWGLSANTKTIAYKPEANYGTNASATLYAIWEVAYTHPRIMNVSVERYEDNEMYAKIMFDYECDLNTVSITLKCKPSSSTEWVSQKTWNNPSDITHGSSDTSKGGNVNIVDRDILLSGYELDKTYDFQITVQDPSASTSVIGILPTIVYPVDFLAGGKGVAFGKAAETENLAEFEFDVKFNGTVRGGVQNILWGSDMTSGWYMTATQTATLSESISSQSHGIILVFSYYTGTSDTNYSWQSFFVPKALIPLTTKEHVFALTGFKYSYTGTKYLYISDTKIDGHSDNKAAGTANGVTYDNSKFVLRYVIGV